MSNLKYLAIGLLIGILLGLLGISAAALSIGQFSVFPSSTFTASETLVQATLTNIPTQTPFPPPTSTLTLTPTMIFPPTETPGDFIQSTETPYSVQASPTPDFVQSMINNGSLIFAGALSNPQQIALFKASLNYAQSTVEDSKRISKEINGVGYGDPSNICGPLAIAILRDAGLLTDTQVTPHDFWLLNPVVPEDHKFLDRVFPSPRFLHIRFTTPINKMDWRSFPLLPGDFLFIWHGSGGNFDHMLVVTRVDSNLSTYSVTNYGTPQGFVITETKLYNPSDPLDGIFHTWTQERNAILGSTGFGGFDLWRPLYP